MKEWFLIGGNFVPMEYSSVRNIFVCHNCRKGGTTSSSRQRSEITADHPPVSGLSSQWRIAWPQMWLVLRLRNPNLEVAASIYWVPGLGHLKSWALWPPHMTGSLVAWQPQGQLNFYIVAQSFKNKQGCHWTIHFRWLKINICCLEKKSK